MKFFMAFLFSIVPAAMVAVPLWFVMGPFAVLAGWAVWALGMDVCLNSAEQKNKSQK